ncbi:MAG: hypothetical protein UHD64_02900, partial [Bacteroidales bacterium]|nr:hypothetical protein [Bacteroidales bacterium]
DMMPISYRSTVILSCNLTKIYTIIASFFRNIAIFYFYKKREPALCTDSRISNRVIKLFEGLLF